MTRFLSTHFTLSKNPNIKFVQAKIFWSITTRMTLTATALVILTIMALTTPTSAQAESKKIQLNESVTAEEYQLPNGLTVFLLPNKKAPSSWVYHWVKAGSLHEKPGITGIAHLFEHMMFRPLTKGAKPFFDQVKELGGNANANTRYHATVYMTNVPNENLPQLLKLEADRFRKMKVTDDLLNVERKAVWSEYSTKFDSNPFIDLWFHLYQVGFPNHPFGWTVVGAREDLEKINAKDCNEFFSKYYKPNNIGLFVGGDFDSAKIKKAILAQYGGWKKGETATLPPPFVAPGKMIQGLGKLPAQAKNALIGFRIPFWSADHATEFELGSYLLLGSRFSLAEKRLKDQLKIVSYIEPFNLEYDPGLFKFLVILNPKTTLDQVIQESVNIVQSDLKKMPEDELQAHVQNYQTKLKESSLRNEGMIGEAVDIWGRYGKLEIYADFLNKPLLIKKEQLVQFFDPIFKKENMVVVTSPEKK